MNQEVPQPTTAMRAPARGEPGLLVAEAAARAQVSGWEASSAAMCVPGVAARGCGSVTFRTPMGRQIALGGRTTLAHSQPRVPAPSAAP